MNRKDSLVVHVDGETRARLHVIQIMDDTKSCVTDVASELLKIAAENACTKQALVARAGRDQIRKSPEKKRKAKKRRYRNRACQFCGEKLTAQGLRMHERYCTENPNRKIRR